MSETVVTALTGAVIGGVIAFVSGWGLYKIQECGARKARRLLFTDALIIDLETSIGIYEKIKSDWEKTQQVWYEHTIELKEYRKFYHLYPDNVLHFQENLRKKLINYYIKTDKMIRLLEVSQDRVMFWIREYQKAVKAAEQTLPHLSPEERQKIVANLIELETNEAANSSKLSEKIISTDLLEFKAEAKTILDLLRKQTK